MKTIVDGLIQPIVTEKSARLEKSTMTWLFWSIKNEQNSNHESCSRGVWNQTLERSHREFP